MAVSGEPVYEAVPHAMVRVPLLSVWTYREVFGASCGSDPEDRYGVVIRQFADPLFREAVWLASPSLAGEAERAVVRTESLAPKRLRAVGSALARYLIRATCRPTPFGAFSGVAVVGWGERLSLRLGEPAAHRRVARLDFAEVLRLVRELEGSQDCRGELRVYANPTAVRRGARLYLPWRDTYGVADRGEDLIIRCTEPVAHVLELAARPTTCARLLDAMVASHPSTPADRLCGFLRSLVEQGVLLTVLRPPMTIADPLAHLVRAAESAGLPASPARDSVGELTGLLGRYNDTPLGAGTEPLRQLLSGAGVAPRGGQQRHVQADVRAAVSGTLPAELRSHAATALRALWRLSPLPARSPELRAYAGEFASRYGRREVRLLDLLDEQFGLGPPAGYRSPAPRRTWPSPASKDTAVREEFLRRAVYSALRRGSGEVELTVSDVDSLPLPEGLPPASVDMFVLLADRAAADGGWLGVLGPSSAGTPGGQSFGRFGHLCPEFAEHLRRLAESEQLAEPDVLFADLRYANPYGHANNVAISPRGHEFQIAVASTPDVDFDRHIELGDIVVGVHHERFYLRSARLGRRVVVRAVHLLSPSSAPNAVRFACEVSEDGYWRPHWSWAELAGMPFLPRLRIGRMVLAPARWRIPTDRSGERDAGFDLGAWRAELAVPRHVYLGTADNRLLLDLDNESHVDELRHQVRHGVEAVEEALPGLEHGAVHAAHGRTHLLEAVLTLRTETVVARDAPPESIMDGYSRAQRLVLPGEGWWSFTLYGPESFRDDLLCGLAAALAEHGREWFFVRYADPLPQLRLRVRDESGGAEVAWLLAELAARVDDGVLARFEMVGYERELDRYGGPAGLDCCERLFCAESPAVVRLIELAGLLPADSDVDSADLALFCADTMLAGLGLDRVAVAELTGRVRRGYAEEFAADSTVSSRALNRELNARRGRLRALLGGTHPVLTDVLRDWASGFRDRIRPIGARLGSLDGELTQPVEQILPSLLHLHANRVGLDRREEYRMTHRLHEVSKDLCNAKVAP